MFILLKLNLYQTEVCPLWKDAGIMIVSDPSWNTDQGVDLLSECLSVKLTRVMKVNGGAKLLAAASTDPEVYGWIWVWACWVGPERYV